MSKVKVLIIQQVLPSYSVDFFNELATYNPDLDLHIAADCNSKSALNQYLGESKFTVHNYTVKYFLSFTYEQHLFRLIKSVRPDIVILSGNVRSLLSIPLMLYLKANKTPIASWGMFHRIGKKKLFSQLYYWLYASLSTLVFPYGKMGLASLSNINVKRSKIHVIGTAINEQRVYRSKEKVNEADLQKLKDSFSIGTEKVVLQVVRLSKIKKPELIIDVAETLVSQNVKFILIGDGEMKSEIQTRIIEKKLEKNVILLGALYDEDELAKWYSLADIFVIPTCIGLSAHHAMAYGLPVITDDSYVLQATESELVINGLNGLTYKEGDIIDFKNKIVSLIECDAIREELSSVASKTVKYAYPMSRKVKNFSEGIEMLVRQ